MVGSASCGIASAILIPSAGLTTIGGLQRGCWGPRGGAVLPGHRGRRHDLRLSPVKSRMLLPAMPVPHRSRQSETSRLTKSGDVAGLAAALGNVMKQALERVLRLFDAPLLQPTDRKGGAVGATDHLIRPAEPVLAGTSMPWRPILIASPPVTVARPSTVGAGGSIPGTTQAARVAWSATLRPTAVPSCGRYRRAPLRSWRDITQLKP